MKNHALWKVCLGKFVSKLERAKKELSNKPLGDQDDLYWTINRRLLTKLKCFKIEFNALHGS